MILIIGYLDYLTPTELSMRTLYLIPLFLSVWDGKGVIAGLFFSIICTIVYFYTELLAGNIHWHGFYLIWEYIIVWSFFITFIIIADKLKKLNLLLRRNNEELKEINNQKDKFFSIIAHDLRGPFQGLIGLTEHMAAENNELSSDEVKTYSQELNKCVINLYKLLENLLEWAKLQKGLVDFTPERIKLSDMFAQSMEVINQRALQKGITLLNEIPETIEIYADEKIMNTILRNLLFNAVKYTKAEGKVVGKARYSDAGMVEISVTDNGVGISPENIGKLFTPGEKVRTIGTEDEPSTGLGLLLCKEFIQKHGGKIWVESKENIGSTFYVTIPGAINNNI
jgi:signal transduction histidine kinase